MKYTLQTKIKFGIALGREKEESIQTMEELGFTQEDIDGYTQEEIEKELQVLYKDWEVNYLDSGWAAFEE